MSLTACAIELMKMVGADLHIRPKVESSHKFTRSAPQDYGLHKFDGVRRIMYDKQPCQGSAQCHAD